MPKRRVPPDKVSNIDTKLTVTASSNDEQATTKWTSIKNEYKKDPIMEISSPKRNEKGTEPATSEMRYRQEATRLGEWKCNDNTVLDQEFGITYDEEEFNSRSHYMHDNGTESIRRLIERPVEPTRFSTRIYKNIIFIRMYFVKFI